MNRRPNNVVLLAGFLAALCPGWAVPASAQGHVRATELPRTPPPMAGILSGGVEYDGRSERSVLLAVAASLVLPGMGELYAGNFETGRYFLIADGVLWLGYAGMTYRSAWIREDARLFAAERAGASFEGRDEQFEVNIGNYLSTDEYNEAKLRNREFSLLYPASGFFWHWRAADDRLRFRSLRIQSDEWKQASRFVVGALVVNRLISAFSAGRAAARTARDQWEFGVVPAGDLLSGSPGVMLRVNRFL